MKITDNEEIKEQKHDYYEDFKLRQLIFNFEDQAESVSIIARDKEGKILHNETFTMEFINCHINLTMQDKGIKSEESLYEWTKVRKE